MDVALISTNPIGRPLASDAARTNASDGGFAATIAAELGDRASTLDRAEGLIGTRIRAPEGGCGCDALVSTVAEPPTTPPIADRAVDRSQATPTPLEPAAATPQARDVSPGRILVVEEPSELGAHLHQTILRNATEMIAANRSGLVEVLPIPWERVQRR